MEINMTTTRTLAASFPLRPLHSLCRMLPLLIAAFVGASVSAMPVGPTVVNGQVTFSYQGKVFSITNSPNAIINWAGFSIRQGELVRFIQQSSNSSVLNRITGQDPSRIMGALQSNGRVYLINPNGIVFGRNAQVNVNGLIASTLDITNQDFINRKNKFVAGPQAGNVANYGAITTPSGGQVLLIAPSVGNNGIITSPQGEIVLAAGRSVQLADSGNPDMHVVVSAPVDQALNLGEVIAQGGKVGIYGALINQRGTINANSAIVGKNGKIVLKASGKTLLEAGSVTTATGAGTGGEIQVLGKQVGLMGDALVDVSGQTGGGTALIGGDYQGKNAAVMNAEQTFVGKDATIKADAIVRGNGGKVIVWGNQTAQVYGSIFARGGALSGNGGFIETSGNFLDVAGIRVNASAANGKSGQWLLDPMDIVVTYDPDLETSLENVDAFATNDSGVTSINAFKLNGAGVNILLQAKRDIFFNENVAIDTNVGLTAQAGNNIYVNAAIATYGANGAIVLSANDNSAGTASRSGKVIIGSAGSVVAHQNTVTIRDSSTSPPPPSADICTIAPNSALCQVLSPPTASEPVKPVQQASNEVIKTITTSTPKTDFDQVAFLDTKKTDGSTSSGSTTTSSADDGKKSDDKKTDTKEVASNDKSGTKNEPAKKMYCN